MKRKTAGSIVVIAMLLLIGCLLSLNASPGYTPRIPPGYVSEVVLHVDYGETPDKIGVLWADPPTPEEYDPASATNLQIVGDRFYLLDMGGVKQYRSPGTFNWKTQGLPGLLGLQDYAVATDGRVYAIWYDQARTDPWEDCGRLSCFDAQGKLLWTKTRDEIVSKEKLKEFGLSSSLPGFYSVVGWTIHGLVIEIGGWDDKSNATNIALLLDARGNLVRALSGTLVGSDGVIYSSTRGEKRAEPLPPTLAGKDLKGNAVRKVRLDFGADRAIHLAGNPSLGPTLPDPTGGFAVYAYAHLPARVPIARKMTTGLEDTLWRFDLQGKFKEEWRFPLSLFALRHREIVLGPQGSVYHLEFKEKGINVVKYSRPGKGNANIPKQ